MGVQTQLECETIIVSVHWIGHFTGTVLMDYAMLFQACIKKCAHALVTD